MQHEADITEIMQLVDNNELGAQWARNHGLISDPAGHRCTLTAGCTGNMYNATVRCIHVTINHRHHFVDPVTGVNTQRIESNWHATKSAILSHTGGVTTSLHGRLTEYAWRVEHKGHEFSSLITEINAQHPQH
jgi:hypothetical protein